MVVCYLAVVLGLSALLWVGAALVPGGRETAVGAGLQYAGGLVPLVVAMGFLFLRHDRRYRSDYWCRLLDPRGVGRMLALALVIPVAVTVFSVGVAPLFGGDGLRRAASSAPQGLSLVGLIAYSLIFGPIPEEMAWRGYALPLILGEVRSYILASGLFGLYWAVWHVPLFFIPGTYQYELGLMSSHGAMFFISLLATAFLYTWVLVRGRGSIMACIFLHWSVNFSGELLQPGLPAEILRTTIWVLIAAVLCWSWRSLGRRGPQWALRSG